MFSPRFPKDNQSMFDDNKIRKLYLIVSTKHIQEKEIIRQREVQSRKQNLLRIF